MCQESNDVMELHKIVTFFGNLVGPKCKGFFYDKFKGLESGWDKAFRSFTASSSLTFLCPEIAGHFLIFILTSTCFTLTYFLLVDFLSSLFFLYLLNFLIVTYIIVVHK